MNLKLAVLSLTRAHHIPEVKTLHFFTFVLFVDFNIISCLCPKQMGMTQSSLHLFMLHPSSSTSPPNKDLLMTGTGSGIQTANNVQETESRRGIPRHGLVTNLDKLTQSKW